MAFHIKSLRTPDWRYGDHHDVRRYLGFGSWDKLPVDFTAHITVPLRDGRETDLVVVKGHTSTTGWRGKSSKHRCFARCPDCNAMVPTGRTHQHKCK
jgi:hypothetical protein